LKLKSELKLQGIIWTIRIWRKTHSGSCLLAAVGNHCYKIQYYFYNLGHKKFSRELSNVFDARSKVQFNSQKDSSRDHFRGAQIPHLRAMVCTSVFKLAIGQHNQQKYKLFGLSEALLH
jgi:hypothetical protein